MTEPNTESAALVQTEESASSSAPVPMNGALENLLSDVPLRLSVELGRVTMSLREVIERMAPGSVISLTKLTGEQLDILINNRVVARGEAVAVGERYGIRITELVSGARGNEGK